MNLFTRRNCSHHIHSVKKIQRAIIPDDYARIAKREFHLQQAAATRRWTGAWEEILVVVDVHGREEPSDELLHQIEHQLQKYRRIGHEVIVRRPEYVAIDVQLNVQVCPDHFKSNVMQELLAVLGNQILPDGRSGLFHPDRITFGEPVRMSAIVATAQAVPGVIRIGVEKFERYLKPHTSGKVDGLLLLGPLEIARMDNDPDFPENGVLELQMKGER